MVRIRAVVLAVLAGLAAWPAAAHAAVGFVDQTPVALDLPDSSTATVELFNGSQQAQDLTLRALRAPGVTVTPATAHAVPPGETRPFAVKLTTAPTAPADGELLAISTDGTSARLALQLGKAPEALPKELNLGTARKNTAMVVAVNGLPPVATPTAVGTLYSTRRDSATVSVEPKGKLRIDGLSGSGTYKGDVDVNGGSSSLTVDVRDGWLLPLVVLLLGVLVGFGIEWWLSRLRPRSLLDRRLARLFDRANRRQERVDKALRGLFIRSRPEDLPTPGENVVWRVPQVVATIPQGVDYCYLSRVGKELSDGLSRARTDPERALFGPDGDKYKGLLADEEIYADLVGDLLEAANVADRAFNELRDMAGVPLRSRFDFELLGWTLGDKQMLQARRDAAKALREAAEHFTHYRRRLIRAEALAGTNPALGQKLETHRELLEHTFAGDADQVSWWDEELPKLELELTTPPSAAAAPVVIVGAGAAPGPLDEHPPPPRPPWAEQLPAPVPDPPWDATSGTLRGFLPLAEFGVGTITLLIVTGSGMSAVYFANSTFGSPGDYLSIALWGSTATAGIALVRRLFPGALTTGT